MNRLRVTLTFDVTMDTTNGSNYADSLRAQMWDYLTKFIRAFNRENGPLQEPHYTARFPTAHIDVKAVPDAL